MYDLISILLDSCGGPSPHPGHGPGIRRELSLPAAAVSADRRGRGRTASGARPWRWAPPRAGRCSSPGWPWAWSWDRSWTSSPSAVEPAHPPVDALGQDALHRVGGPLHRLVDGLFVLPLELAQHPVRHIIIRVGLLPPPPTRSRGNWSVPKWRMMFFRPL